jgi:hypothetical protein
MTPKILPEHVGSISFMEYRKLIVNDFKRFAAAQPTANAPLDFILFGASKFSDAPGKALPFLMLGDIKKEGWEVYFKQTGAKRKERDFAMGTAYLSKKASGAIILNFEVKKGKIKAKYLDLLDKALLKHLKIEANVVQDGGLNDEDDDSSDSGAEEKTPVSNPAPNANSANEKQDPKEQKKAEAIAQQQAKMQAQAKDLNSYLATYKALYQSVKKEIVPKLEQGTSRRDLIQIQNLTKAYDTFMMAFKAAHKSVQKTFASVKSELDKQRTEIAKVTKATQAKKQSLAQQLADAFFQKNAQRKAQTKEVELMQASLKAAIAYRKIESLSPEEKALHLKAISLTAQLRGPKFQPQDTDKVFAKLGA